MKTFLSFLAGVLLGVAGHWYFTQPQPAAALAEATENARAGATNLARALEDTFNAQTVKEQMARTGRVIREKLVRTGEGIADATANARTTAAIKAKLMQHSGLSAFKIDVDTTDGVVTLSGAVSSFEEIATAMNLAWETDGVYKVISTLQVKPE